jgi:hypothetical protein
MENLPHVDTEALMRESRTIREAATRLVRELRLVEQLQQFGEVEMAGGYRWDLMLRADLDFYVINPAVDLDLALEALNGFVRRGDCRRFGFIDSLRGKPWQATPESYPVGFYLGMGREFGGWDWKIETWFLRSPYPHPDWLLKPVTEEARRTILRLKHLRNSGHLNADSFHLYQAVLIGGARELEEVRAWLDREAAKQNGPDA